MKRSRVWLVALALAGFVAAPAVRAEDPVPKADPDESTTAPPASSGSPAQAAEETEGDAPPIFIPPSREAPRLRIGSATRGGPDTLELFVIAPERVGLTLATQPVLYWYLSQPTDRSVTFTLRRTARKQDLAEFPLESPQSAGLHAIRLADRGVSLTRDVDYQWFVSLATEGGDSERVAGGGIARVAATSELGAQLAAASLANRARVLARAGIWYDAVDALVQRIEDAPEIGARRRQLAGMLEQVGLDAVARAERDRAAGHSRAATTGSVPLPIYSPPKPVRASYPRNLAGLGARGTEASAKAVRLFALAPNHLGVSVRPQPTLYFFLEADSELPVAFTLIGEGAAQPLLELELPAPLQAGLHAVSLTEHATRLAPETRYEWSAALVDGERQVHPTISVGFIEYRAPEPDLARELAAAGSHGAVHAYARRGLWYDAFEDVTRRIAKSPHDVDPILQRAALLDQVGLGPVAESERKRAAAGP